MTEKYVAPNGAPLRCSPVANHGMCAAGRYVVSTFHPETRPAVGKITLIDPPVDQATSMEAQGKHVFNYLSARDF